MTRLKKICSEIQNFSKVEIGIEVRGEVFHSCQTQYGGKGKGAFSFTSTVVVQLRAEHNLYLAT